MVGTGHRDAGRIAVIGRDRTNASSPAPAIPGNGLTFGTLTGMMAADRFSVRKNPWADLLDPARKSVRGGLLDYLRRTRTTRIT